MQDYANAILAGANNNNLAPTSSPIIQDTARLAAISGANASKFAADQIGATGNALAGTADNQADQNMAGIKMALLKEQEKEAEAKRMLDPGNYKQVENGKGGYDFVDPNGKKITVDTYAKITGKNRADLLSDSQDPEDVAFVNDYKNLQDVLEATVNKDKAKLEEYYKNQPDLRNMKPQDLINRFKSYYGGYFTDQRTQRKTSKSNAFASMDAASGNNAYGSDENFN